MVCPAWPCTVLGGRWCPSDGLCGLRELMAPPLLPQRAGVRCGSVSQDRQDLHCVGCKETPFSSARAARAPQPQARAPPIVHTQSRRFPSQRGKGQRLRPRALPAGRAAGQLPRPLSLLLAKAPWRGKQPPAWESWVTSIGDRPIASSHCFGASP